MQGSSVSVFVRVRPLIPGEVKELPGLRLHSSDQHEANAAAFVAPAGGGTSSIAGFTGVLGTDLLNADVFQRCFEPRLQSVLRGGTASLFCYGYTGSGKTHTIIGYGEERGLYFLAAESLLQKLRSSVSAGDSSDGELCLRATACEMYNDEVYDLLGPSKIACTLRVDDSGQLQVLGPLSSVPLDASESGIFTELLPPDVQLKAAEVHSTLVTRAVGLRSSLVHQPEDLQGVQQICVKHREVGASTEHSQSSRSHALLRMEVVNKALLDATDILEQARAEVPARQNASDNAARMKFTALYEGYDRCLHPPNCCKDQWGCLEVSPDQIYVIIDEGASRFQLRDHKDKGHKTLEEWGAHFGVPGLVAGYNTNRRKYITSEKWEETRRILEERQHEMSLLVAKARGKVEQALHTVEEVKRRGPVSLGGSLLLVDLAGADYDHRGGQQQKESAAINKSLLALKECFRALAKESSAKPKFRDSKLTRLLEDSLSPSESSSRSNRESASVMLVNISPAEHIGKMTFNTLRYGQLFASASETNRSLCSSTRPKFAASKIKATPSAVAAELKPCDPKIKEELHSIYTTYCPQKTVEDVMVILNKYAGREEELLQKAREKYVCAG